MIGPVSTLPGAESEAGLEDVCDEHPDRPALVRIQGETDSFGAEFINCCAECASEFRSHMREARVGRCDWCRQDARDLCDYRDAEEGFCGPVYRVCGGCRHADAARWQDS